MLILAGWEWWLDHLLLDVLRLLCFFLFGLRLIDVNTVHLVCLLVLLIVAVVLLMLLKSVLLHHEDLLDLLGRQVLVDHFLFSWEAVVFDLLFASFDLNLLLALFFDFVKLLLQAVLMVLVLLTDDQTALREDLLELLLRHFKFVRVLLIFLLQVFNQHLALLFVQLVHVEQHVFVVVGLLFLLLLLNIGLLV